MAEHRKTDFIAKITWIGRVPKDPSGIRSEAMDVLPLTYAGVPGEQHEGLTRASCVRVKDRHPTGTDIRNTRQLSILSAEEMAEIAAEIGLDALEPEQLGASLVIEGIPDFTYVPPASRLQADDGTTIVVDVENGPCNWPAREIEKDAKGHGKAFKAAARGKRGVTAWVEREGTLKVGDTLKLFIPDQPAWPHG
ncbi:MOSC domain-containing protein [Sulfitobacter aestuariivivens]|uniref:MOSC domain-containing protein n=1 Tax=Sulfitobacter aestuariivivens TaxID=2766981 RepID=A0A927D2L3_9RHOB|nr:MOSC domain-containing protein [Sulfitobacter aestuariivivens]